MKNNQEITIDQWKKIPIKEIDDFVKYWKKKKGVKSMTIEDWDEEMIKYIESLHNE